MIGFIKRLFSKEVTDELIFTKLGKRSYIRNGVGYGFVSDDYLYDNVFIEVGFGRVRSGRGDWGGGFEYTTDSPLKVVLDKNLIIQKVTTHSFYNSRSSQETEKLAKKLKDGLVVGEEFKFENAEFKVAVKSILEYLPCKNHIGWDVFDSPHMLAYFTKPEDRDHYYGLEDPKSIK